jgi:hypothetical protein
MATRFTGGCICGGVRYGCVADPIAMRNCHCRDCQRAAGSSMPQRLLVPASAESITGEQKYYDVTGGSAGASDRSGLTLTTQPVIRYSPV